MHVMSLKKGNSNQPWNKICKIQRRKQLPPISQISPAVHKELHGGAGVTTDEVKLIQLTVPTSSSFLSNEPTFLGFS